jgi:hypothetical protein
LGTIGRYKDVLPSGSQERLNGFRYNPSRVIPLISALGQLTLILNITIVVSLFILQAVCAPYVYAPIFSTPVPTTVQ